MDALELHTKEEQLEGCPAELQGAAFYFFSHIAAVYPLPSNGVQSGPSDEGGESSPR